MYGTAWALLPALIAIILALLTKEVYSSLFLGILIGAFLAAGFHPAAAFNLIVVDGLSASVAGLAGNFCFLVLLGSLIALVNKTGGSRAFGTFAEKHVRSRLGAQLAAFVLGILIFIDDYFNCLTVGSVMRPVTDRYRISRAKLAFIIDATAAPVCMIAPVSSWAAAVSGVANDMGTGITGIQLFIRSIPYNFYSLLTLVFIPVLIFMDFDYGKMKTARLKALEGDLCAADAEEDEMPDLPKGRIFDLVFPVVLLIVLVFLAMLYAGGFFGATPWIGAENAGSLIASLGDTDAFIALPLGSLVTFLIACVYFLGRRTIRFKEMMECIPKGFSAMIPSILILTLASSLKTVTSALGAAEFVQGVMMQNPAALSAMLPAVIFAVSCALAFATGTSWGTFGILIPVAAAAFSMGDPRLIIGISACLAGAVCGDHCSPISDTTVMSSAGAQIRHIDHVSTQLPYALTIAAVSFVAYIIAGITKNWPASFGAGIALTIAVLFILKRANGNASSAGAEGGGK